MFLAILAALLRARNDRRVAGTPFESESKEHSDYEDPFPARLAFCPRRRQTDVPEGPRSRSEELVRISGLPRSALIEVGNDHRLADQEPLERMLRECESFSKSG
jgi:hypothetical protein